MADLIHYIGSSTKIIRPALAPDITMDTPLSFNVGDSFADPGATATDHKGVAINYTVDTTNVNFNAAGSYNVTYTATDLVGRQTQLIRSLTVVQPPPDTGLDTSTWVTQMAGVPQEYTSAEDMITGVEALSRTTGSVDANVLFAPFAGMAIPAATVDHVTDVTSINNVTNNLPGLDITGGSALKFKTGSDTASSSSSNQFRPLFTSPFVMPLVNDYASPISWTGFWAANSGDGSYKLHRTAFALTSSHVLCFVTNTNVYRTDVLLDDSSSGFIREDGDILKITLPRTVTAAELYYLVSRQRHYRLGGQAWEYYVLEVT